MSYQERIRKYEIEKKRLIRSDAWKDMSPAQRDAALQSLIKKWKV